MNLFPRRIPQVPVTETPQQVDGEDVIPYPSVMEFGWSYYRTARRIINAKLDVQTTVLTLVILLVIVQEHHLAGSVAADLPRYTMCNSGIDMSADAIDQGELELVIQDHASTNMRVSCDVRIEAGYDKHVMFYITDLYLGAPNGSYRMEKACIEPRDVNGYHESRLIDMRRSRICSSAEVELGSYVYATTGSALLIRFYRNRGFSLNAYLKIVFTAFRLGTCRTNERKCRNERCIAHSIVCNEHNPCGDYSDCPTGLEHLSSWAMSGIVILAILSGGIIIIMGTVCLQRAGSKQTDWDDMSTTMADARIDNNVELTDVIATTKERRVRTEKTDDLCGLSRVKPECVPLNNPTSTRLKDIRICLENEKPREHNLLLASEAMSTCMTYPQSDSLLNTPFDSFEASERSSETVNTTVSSHTQSPVDALDNSVPLVPEVTSSFHPRRTPDAFSLSDNSIVLTDSDSGTERERTRLVNPDKIKRERASRGNKVPVPLPSNGVLQQQHAQRQGNNQGNYVFSDFKPPAPAYCNVYS